MRERNPDNALDEMLQGLETPRQPLVPGLDRDRDRPTRTVERIYEHRPSEASIGRSYKCPNCGGEFDSWDRDPPDDIGRRRLNSGKCPFCALKRGQYDPEDGESE